MKRLMIAAGVIALAMPLVAQQPSASSLFHEGLMLERAQGSVAQAIVLFERAIAEFPSDPEVPQAMAHLAEVYEKRNDPRATRLWTRLMLDYPSSPFAATARRKVAQSQSASVGPFPARTVDVLREDVSWWLSPDGRTVAHIKKESPTGEIWLQDVDSGRERKLVTEQGRETGDALWSPDSKRLAIYTNDPKAARSMEDNPHEIRIFNVQDGQSRIVATMNGGVGRSFINWSPDSRWLFAQIGTTPPPSAPTGEFRLIDASTGTSKKIGGAAQRSDWMAWTADGRRVVYEATTRNASGGNDDAFFVVSVDSGDVRPWSPPFDLSKGRINLASGVTRRGTPDDRVLIRQVGGRGAGNNFYLTPIDGGSPELTCTSLPPVQCMAAMTPDGRFRAATDAVTKRIVLFDRTKPGTSTRITTGFSEERSPRFSPDGRLLLFTSNLDGEWALYVVPVDRIPVSAPIRVTTIGSANATAETWSAAGRTMLDYSYEDQDVYRISVDKTGHSIGTVGRLTQDSIENGVPTISPDSKAIAYIYDKGIAVMTADGAGERPVLPVDATGHLEWQSGDRVIFQKSSTAGISLLSLNVNTGAVQPLAELPAPAGFWQFVAARNEIVYATVGGSAGTYQLHARNLATTADRIVATIQDLLTFKFAFRVSPDATQIAYGKWVGTNETRHPELHVMTIDGRNDRLLPTSTKPAEGWRPSGYPYDWSPDGRFLIFDDNPGRLMVMDVANGQSWAIPQAADDDNSEWSSVQWAPDGSFIVLERYSYRDEWRLFDGLTYDNVVKLMDAKK